MSEDEVLVNSYNEAEIILGKMHKALARAMNEEELAKPQEPKSIPRSKQTATGKARTSPSVVPQRSNTVRRRIVNKNRPGLQAESSCDSRLVVLSAPTSPEAENFRMLRTRILHPVDNAPPRSILITSTLPEEGKSFVCANLAAAIALGMEKHALIIDADLRKPTQAQIFAMNNNLGLVNHLRDNHDLGTLIQKSRLDKLSLITSGIVPLNPSELLDSHKMSAMIFEAVSRYPDRLIIIDSPPLKAAAETAVLAKYVDAVLLVVRWGHAKKEQVQQAVDLIGRDKIIGTVFNACPLASIKDQYHGYYGYSS